MLYSLWIFLLYLLLVGMAAGWVGWLVAGKPKSLSQQNKPKWAVVLPLGVAGSFVAGLAASFLAGEGFELRPAGMFASVVGAIVVTWAYSAIKK